MSLKVWLPLNGDLRNQGSSNVEVTNNGAVVNSAGKIGSCYSFGTSSSYMTLPPETMTGFGTECSVSFWIKILSWNTSYATYFQAGKGGTAWNNYIFGFLRNSSGSTICFTISNGSSASNNSYLTSTINLNTWYHIVLVYKTGKCQIYLNGVLDHEYDTTIVPKFSDISKITIGTCNATSSYQTNCLLNDFRIYDHALSVAEVREIAQGLVLHYKLNNPYMESSIFLDSTVDNTTAYNASIGKYGYNSTSNLAKTIGIFKGKNSVKISTITAGQTAQPYTYFSNLFTSNGTNAPAYKALSFDYYTTCPTTTWLNIYKLGSGTGTATWKTTNTAWIKSGTYNNSSNSILVNPNEWNHIEIIFNGTSDTNAEWGYCINGPAHTSSADYYFLYANIQLEQNDHATGQGASLHDNIIVDSSGYNHNGTITGAFTLNTSTLRYNYSLSMNNTSTSNHIETDAFTLPDVISVSFWAKANKSTNQVLFADPVNGIEFGFLNSLAYTKTTRVAGWTTTNFVNDEWNHIVVEKNGSTFYLYINGILETQNGASNYYTHTGTKLWLLNRSANNNYAANASISDFRIYCTQLLDNDIKVLYNTTMRIDPHKNIHNFELNENAPYNKLTPTGMLEDNMVESYLTLSDGSKWKLMLFHYVDGGNNLFTSSNATYCNEWGLYSRLSEITNYQYDGKYEYYVIQDGTQFRWTQTSSPTASSISGLTTVSGYTNPVNGLAKASQNNTYIGYNAWWGACGCWTSYTLNNKKGIPGFGPHSADGICTKYLILYTRVSDFGGTFEDGTAFSNNFIEM